MFTGYYFMIFIRPSFGIIIIIIPRKPPSSLSETLWITVIMPILTISQPSNVGFY